MEHRRKIMNKTTYTVIKTEAVTFPEEKDVYSILAVESDGENAFTELAYDIARDPETADKIIKEIQRISPSLSDFLEAIEDFL